MKKTAKKTITNTAKKSSKAKATGKASGKKAGGRIAEADKANKKKRSSGLDAAAQILADAGEPLNTKEMVERMLAKGLWQTTGKTPAATIYAAIIREIAIKGKDARFRKTDRGRFELTAARTATRKEVG